ncbi:MAG: hypothetical protein J3R72DRAFT_137575 [Linnemannia gamsii]|nr:MAG: hypothetical protein J3R72DRAFT_137575 [Linnemannia gamsii]
MDTKVSNTSETTQHPTPPASSASSTPSPSNASLHPHAARAIQATSAGYRTPPPQIARNSGTRVSVFHDTQIFPRSNSQSSLFSAASEAGTETPKRRATEAPLSRPRSQTFQARPQSMCGSSNSQSFLPQSSHYSLGVNGSSTPRNYLGSHQQDQAQEFSLPQPSDAMDCKSLESDSSSPPSNESNDPIESGSNKRPKIQPRALRGRGDRATSWHGKPPPTLRSDSSMIADLNLTSVNDDDDFPKTPVARTPAPFIVWQDNEEKTPVKKSGLRRAPLTDISLSIGTSTMVRIILTPIHCVW